MSTDLTNRLRELEQAGVTVDVTQAAQISAPIPKELQA